MQPRSMLFTLYGVYIRHFSKEIWLGTLIKLLAEFGFSEQAVRAALTRLTAQGWIEMRKTGRNNYVRLTPKAVQRVDEAADRIYRLQSQSWDGRWFLLTYSIPEEKRKLRDQLRNELNWLGFGMLGPGLWVTPHDLEAQVRELAENTDLLPYLDFFNGYHCGPQPSQELVTKCWNLAAISKRYQQFLETFQPAFEQAKQLMEKGQLQEQQCFLQRTWLVHEYRKFLHIDPALPGQLLGEDWRGSEAFDLFRKYDSLLAEKAGHYFYQFLVGTPNQKLSDYEVEQALKAQLDPFGVKMNTV